MTESGYCRLCAEIKLCSNLIPLNKNDVELNTNMCYKISQCFQIQITSDDNLPKTICLDCCTQMNVTYEFYQKVHKAQELLRDVVFNPLINDNCSIGCIPSSIEIVTNDNNIETLQVKTKHEEETNIKTETNVEHVPDIEITGGLWDDNKLEFSSNENISTKSSKESDKKATSKKKKSKRIKEGSHAKKIKDFADEWKDYIWRCNICSKELNTRKELIEHFQEMHDKPPEYTCLYCATSITKYRAFIRHVRVHKNQNKFSCNVCNKRFHDKKIARHHMKFVHQEAKLSKYVCTVCGKSFKYSGSFKYHTLNIHVPDDERLKYECDICHKKLATEQSFTRHKEIHDDSNKHFTCEKCGSRFGVIRDLEEHMEKVHADNSEVQYFQCPLCPSRLKNEKQLIRHEREIHLAKKRFECETCGKVFSQLSKFKFHLTIHTGERRYKCQHCEKRFRFNQQLENHIRVHTGEKPYCCFDCVYYFANFGNYINHMKRKHGVTSFKNVKKVTDVKIADTKS